MKYGYELINVEQFLRDFYSRDFHIYIKSYVSHSNTIEFVNYPEDFLFQCGENDIIFNKRITKFSQYALKTMFIDETQGGYWNPFDFSESYLPKIIYEELKNFKKIG